VTKVSTEMTDRPRLLSTAEEDGSESSRLESLQKREEEVMTKVQFLKKKQHDLDARQRDLDKRAEDLEGIINQLIKIFIVPLQDPYSEVLPTQAKRKRTVSRRWWI